MTAPLRLRATVTYTRELDSWGSDERRAAAYWVDCLETGDDKLEDDESTVRTVRVEVVR